MIVHGGLIAARIGGAWRGALIEGASGDGKSDLALRAIDAGFRLCADDRVELWASGARLYGCAPPSLQGLIEARGLDVVRLPALAFCEVALVVQFGTPERLPEPRWVEREGLQIPAFLLAPYEASAPLKLRLALEHTQTRRP
ncbi:HPr kinase/phosphorylase [Phenylobacterium sp.]|uniref:HPr kinase/phosphorylase n=1 Tax=Phenylobacterium sp. TaxID=1871053 RepID=UPI0027370286|nr:HPr kinase/phosphorylase [Phenylobacterium sp.]MDP3659256.1 HPr kinase/phosphorylase [Phenylobacterium sp.]